MPDYQRHYLSQVWGDLSEEESRELVASVEAWGFEDPNVTVHESRILDGWNRYVTAEKLGRTSELLFHVFDGDDPAAFVIRKNAHRRHLTPGQRAACVVACREWAPEGRPRNSAPGAEYSPPATDEQMAAEAAASVRTVQQAKRAEEAGLGEAVRSGEMSAKAAAEQAQQQTISPPAPKPPTRTERLEAQVDILKMEVQDKAQRIEELEQQVRFLKGEGSEHSHEREATFNAYRAEINSLRGSVAEWQMKHNDEHRRANWWERQAKALGWKSSQGTGNEQIPLPKADEAGGVGEPAATVHPGDHGPEDREGDPVGFQCEGCGNATSPLAPHDGMTLCVDCLPGVDEEILEDFEMEDPQPSAWELTQWVGPFRKGDWVVLPSGEQGVVQDLAPDGRAMVATEYGTGRIKPFGFDQIKPRPENPEAGL